MDEQERPPIKDIVDMWAMEYGNRIPVLASAKIEAFCRLFDTFKDYGYEKNDAKSIEAYVTKICVPENYKAKERKTWLEQTKLNYNQALLSTFSPILLRANEKKNFIPPEKYVPKPKVQEEPDPDKMGDPAYQPHYENEYDEPIRKYKEVDKTRFAHIETTKPDFDDLFAELDSIGTDKEGKDE